LPDSHKYRILLVLLVTLTALSVVATTEAQKEGPLIKISLAPPVINADGQTHRIIVVQLQHGNGQPYIAPEDFTVYLTSSNLDIGTVSEQLTIPKGKSYARGNFTSSYNEGLALITASAEEFQTGSAVLQVIKSDFDAKLVVYGAPSLMPAVKDVEGRAVIQIMDFQGVPYNALRDVTLTLTSSNHSGLTLPDTAVIKKGENYVEVTYVIQGEVPGTALVYAHAQNFEPGQALITITNETRKAHGLQMYFAPNVLLPDQGTHTTITVQIVDVDGNPVKAIKDTLVTLTSSNLNIATISETLTITKDGYHATTIINTRYLPGETIIAASSPSLSPIQGILQVSGNLPRLLEIYPVPERIIANNDENEVITIQVLDEDGDPINADRDITVYLSSSSSRVGTVPIVGTIAKGSSYITLPFKATERPGVTTIIATTQGLEPSEVLIETVALVMNVTLTTPKSILLNQTFNVHVNVTSYGQPVTGAKVKWTALGGVIKQEDTESDSLGVSSAQIVQKYEQLNLKADVTMTGYAKQTAQKSIKITQTTKTELTVNIFGTEVSVFLLLIALAVIIAISLGAYLYLKYRRRREGKEDLEVYP
jgi:hypothetical protein